MTANDSGSNPGGEGPMARPTGRRRPGYLTVLQWGLRGLRVTLALVTLADQLELLDGGVRAVLVSARTALTAATWYMEWLLHEELSG